MEFTCEITGPRVFFVTRFLVTNPISLTDVSYSSYLFLLELPLVVRVFEDLFFFNLFLVEG